MARNILVGVRGHAFLTVAAWCERGAATSSVANSARIRTAVGVTQHGDGGALPALCAPPQ